MHQDLECTCVIEHSYANRIHGKIGREVLQTYEYTSIENITYMVAIILRVRVDV